MKTTDIIESEKDQLQDYLFSYCDNPLETASPELAALFNGTNLDVQDTRYLLEEHFVRMYECGGVPGNLDNTIWLNIAEIEISVDLIDPDEIEEYTIHGEYAYLYTGYGFMAEFNLESLAIAIKEKTDYDN